MISKLSLYFVFKKFEREFFVVIETRRNMLSKLFDNFNLINFQLVFVSV